MAKIKLGLQKEVSKIFTGIQIPKKGGTADKEIRPAITSKPEIAETIVSPIAPAEEQTAVVSETIIFDPVQSSPVVKDVPEEVPVITPQASAAPTAAAAGKVISPKTTGISPKPYTIPEPAAQSAGASTRQVVYEPPKPRQTNFTQDIPVSSTAGKQSKLEPSIKQNSALLKLIEKIKAKLFTTKNGPTTGRQRMMILISPVLVIILLLVVVNAVKKSPKKTAKPSQKPVTAALSDNKIIWQIPQPIPARLRDPMVFGAVSTPGKQSTEGPVVKGIVFSEDSPSAVVGERIVTAGDTVAGAKIEKINRDSVEFSMGDKKWTQKVER